MTHPIINTLKMLSAAASENLPLLEQYDYTAEAKADPSATLPLNLAPKTLKAIIDEVMLHFYPVITRTDNLPDNALLSKANLEIFIENLNATADRDLAHEFLFINLKPIRTIADYFDDLNQTKPARFLRNACTFASSIRRAYEIVAFGAASRDLPAVVFIPTYVSEDLNAEEQIYQDNYAIFNGIFKKDAFKTAQRKALYEAFYNESKSSDNKYPHLVIIACVIYLMTQPATSRYIKGKFNTVARTVLDSLNLPSDKAENYGLKSLKTTGNGSLLSYEPQAKEIVSKALGKTR